MPSLHKIVVCALFAALVGSACSASPTLVTASPETLANNSAPESLASVDLDAADPAAAAQDTETAPSATAVPPTPAPTSPPEPTSAPAPTPTPEPTPTPVVLRSAATATAVPAAPTAEPDSEPAPTAGPPASTRSPSGVTVINVGDCFTQEEMERGVTQRVSCRQPHSAEAFAVRELVTGDVAYPGSAALVELARSVCQEDFYALTGTALYAATFGSSRRYPSADSWHRGHRDLVCFASFEQPITVPLAEVNPLRSFGYVSRLDLQVGECIANARLRDNNLAVVDCEAPHHSEVYWTGIPEAAGQSFDSLGGNAGQACVERMSPDRRRQLDHDKWTFFGTYLSNDLEWIGIGPGILVCVIRSDFPTTGWNVPPRG